MKQVYELRHEFESVGIFPSADKAVKAMKVYIEYLEVNNGITVTDSPSNINVFSSVVMSNNSRLYILERDLFGTITELRKYLGL